MKEVQCTKQMHKVGNSLYVMITKEAKMLGLDAGCHVDIILRVRDE